ncbi:phage tail spike protein [Cytobacillus purgationiresistens]|uniref:Phage minor structural protein n=1 Tax=Cytobacillus purgationiresistens TaxID=863449 RepID=A0ABU0ACM4_9BACI|nr:phage tail spike protein [Cytobacillus purgationiresistens]MDQ0269009.1 phage minor structural protein [Cytobacillus purgationiresistens]
MIHILDKQTDSIISFLSKEITAAEHNESLDNQEFLDFTVRVGEKSQYVKERNRAIILGEDGTFREFIIMNSETLSDEIHIKSNASFFDLDKQRIISPVVLEGQLLESAAASILAGTEWRVGVVEFSGSERVVFEDYLGAFQALKEVSSLYEVEMRFRVEVKGNKIEGRFVDFFRRRGRVAGKEVVFGKDLIEIRRIEDSQNIVTALFCIGPEKADGSRMTTAVFDDVALQRWGRNGRHLWSIYEADSSDQEMTLSRLTEMAQEELEKRLNSLVKYETTQAVLDNLPGSDHEKVLIADTIRIKDLHFTPPLYAEARAYQVRRSLLDKSQKEYVLGDFIQYSEDHVRKRFKELQKVYGVKVIKSPMAPTGKYNIIWIDTSDSVEIIKTWNGIAWVKATPTRAEEIGAETPQGAQQRADKAREKAQDYADERDELLQVIIRDEITEEGNNALNEAKLRVEELKMSVDKDILNLNNEADNLMRRVSESEKDLEDAAGTIISIEQDMDTLNGALSTTISRLSNMDGVLSEQQASLHFIAGELEAKASQTSVDAITGRLTSAETTISQQATSISLKANVLDVYTKSQMNTQLNEKLDFTIYNNKMTQLDVSIAGITGRVENTELTINDLSGAVTSANHHLSTLEQTADSITSRVSSLETDLDNVNGGYNFIQNSQFRGGFQGWIIGNGTWTVDSSKKILGEDSVKFNHTAGTYPMLRSIMVEVQGTEIIGKDVTLSVYIFVPNDLTFSSGNNPYIQICGYSDPNSTANASFKTFIVPNDIARDKWVRISLTATIGSKVGTVDPVKYIAGLLRFNGTELQRASTFWYGLPQMEIGNRATNWTPSPKDLSNRVDLAEAELSIHAGEISSKVSSLDYSGANIVSMINQTASNIKIAAENIDLVGKVTATMLNVTSLSSISSNIGTVTAGTINGISLNSVTINTTRDITVGNNLLLGTSASNAVKKITFNGTAATSIQSDGYNFTINSGGKMILSVYQELYFDTNILYTSANRHFHSAHLDFGGGNSNIENVNNIYTLGDRVRIQNNTAHFMGNGTVNLNSMATNGGIFSVGADSTGARVWSMSIYNRTYSANSSVVPVVITNQGTLGIQSSAAKYKLAIEEMRDVPYKNILNLAPKTWYDKTASETYSDLLAREADGETIDWEEIDLPENVRSIGFIAEDIYAEGLGKFVIRNKRKEIESISYSTLWIPLVPIVSEHEDKISKLEKRIIKLENIKED